MTLKKPRIPGIPTIGQPRTKHEEIMDYIESTNDIVSENSNKIQKILDILYDEYIVPDVRK